jgi:uncharacterized protein YbjQ (UPF0145 family)
MQLPMLIATTDAVPGKRIVKTLGLVRGNTVRARHIGSSLLAALRTIVGGEAHGYTKLLQDARDESIARMTSEAHALGANAIVGTRFVTAEIMSGTAELLAYGTAVVVEDA